MPLNLTPYRFIIRFLLLFTALYILFPFYWGITGKGGVFYSSFLAEYVDLIRFYSTALTKAAKAVLDVLGFETHQKQYNALRIAHSRGIVVNPSCLGWGVISFWIAFVIANEGNFWRKIKWLSFGVLAIVVINILRIALIALANHLEWNLITELDHHLSFNIVSYGFIFLLTIRYIASQRNYEKHFNSKQKSKD